MKLADLMLFGVTLIFHCCDGEADHVGSVTNRISEISGSKPNTGNSWRPIEFSPIQYYIEEISPAAAARFGLYEYEDEAMQNRQPQSWPLIMSHEVAAIPVQRNAYNKTIPSSTSTDMMSNCDGVDSLLSDLGRLSYILGIAGTSIGFYTMLISFITQIQTALSTYIVGIPSSFIALNGFFGNPDDVPTEVTNLYTWFSIIDTFVNFTFATTLNGLINITDIFGAIFSFLSLYLGAISTFPGLAKIALGFLLASNSNLILESYGC